jgi:hypothetical protein
MSAYWKVSHGDAGKAIWRRVPRWTIIARGRVYRPVMRLMHRMGWCHPEPVPADGGVWCHWCGLRGSR